MLDKNTFVSARYTTVNQRLIWWKRITFEPPFLKKNSSKVYTLLKNKN